jgi:pilus assembly protein CpaE
MQMCDELSIDASSDVCMVSALDTLSLKNTKLGLETLALMGYEPEKIKFILNRADSNVGLTRDEVVAVVGREPDVLVPSNREVVRAVNAGRPVALLRGREASRSFHHLAALYSGDTRAHEQPMQRGPFGRKRWLG